MEPKATNVSMFGDKANALLKPEIKNFLLMKSTIMLSKSSVKAKMPGLEKALGTGA